MFLISSSDKPGAGLDLDLLLLAGAEILGGHVEDSVGVDVEGRPSICGIPRGRPGGMPVSWKLAGATCCTGPSRAHPCRTWISTEGWLSSAVEKTSPLRVGIVVFALDQLGHHAALGLDPEGPAG